MNYGYFDEKNKEYVITRPDTPSAWANYLGSPEYGAIISNNAGGYSFVKSQQILHLLSNSLVSYFHLFLSFYLINAVNFSNCF